MVSRKYLKDYRVVETIDAKGRVRSDAVYTGGDFTLSPSVGAGDKRIILCLSILSAVAFLGALIPVTHASRIIYVTLPFVFSALSMYMMIGAAVMLLRVEDVTTREKAEKTANRLPPSALVTAILSFASFAAGIGAVVVLRADVVTGDIIFIALSLVISVSSAVSFSKCRKIKAVRMDEESPEP